MMMCVLENNGLKKKHVALLIIICSTERSGKQSERRSEREETGYALNMHIQSSDETSPAGELKESSQPCNANHYFH